MIQSLSSSCLYDSLGPMSLDIATPVFKILNILLCFQAGVARQGVGPMSLRIVPRACKILNILLLLPLLLLLTPGAHVYGL